MYDKKARRADTPMSKRRIKVSLITTEFNEAQGIREFIDSSLAQSMKPDEIVIADAGSSDGTVQIIKEYIKKGAPITLVKAPGNRSVGRNAAIKAAKHEYIAVADVGCRLDKDWLLNITEPFREHPQAEVISGFFKPDPKTYFETVSSHLMTARQKEIDVDTWLPSSRSFAFTKNAWKKVNGYPEYEEFGDAFVARMCGGEDTLYDLKLRKAGYKFWDGLRAVVYWRPRTNIKEFYRQYWMYSVGDGIRLVDLNYFRGLIIRYGFVLLLAALFTALFQPGLLILLLLFTLRLYLRVKRKWKTGPGGIESLLLMMLLIVVYEVAQIMGFVRGYSARMSLPKKTRRIFEGL